MNKAELHTHVISLQESIMDILGRLKIIENEMKVQDETIGDILSILEKDELSEKVKVLWSDYTGEELEEDENEEDEEDEDE